MCSDSASNEETGDKENEENEENEEDDDEDEDDDDDDEENMENKGAALRAVLVARPPDPSIRMLTLAAKQKQPPNSVYNQAAGSALRYGVTDIFFCCQCPHVVPKSHVRKPH